MHFSCCSLYLAMSDYTSTLPMQINSSFQVLIFRKLFLVNRNRLLILSNFRRLHSSDCSNTIPGTMFNFLQSCLLMGSLWRQQLYTLSTFCVPSLPQYLITVYLTDVNECSLNMGWYPISVKELYGLSLEGNGYFFLIKASHKEYQDCI